jgi:SAM-dependent methyltransferase
MLKRIIRKIQDVGFVGLVMQLYRRFFPKRIASLKQIRNELCGKSGFETGGPSCMFSSAGLIPIYDCIASLDNCNFSSSTAWEDNISEGRTFVYSEFHEAGTQYIAEASDLEFLEDERHDFVLSSHNLEHLANPLKGLYEWKRILKKNGFLLLVLPHKDGTFDHKRQTTPLTHMIEDFNNHTNETDLTHFDEILEFHDLSLDPGAGSMENFIERSKNNYENRCFHHHVFDTDSAIKLVDYAGFKIINVEVHKPYNIIIFAQKSTQPNNVSFLENSKTILRNSPLRTDRQMAMTK